MGLNFSSGIGAELIYWLEKIQWKESANSESHKSSENGRARRETLSLEEKQGKARH